MEAPLPERLFALLQQWGVELSNQRSAVIGSPHGRLGASLARRGAHGCTLVQGHQPTFANRSRFPQVIGDDQCPPWPAQSLDLLLVRGQFPSSRALATLVPGGWCVLVNLTWVPEACGPSQAAERCLERHGLGMDQERGHGLHPNWMTRLQQAGFEGLVSASNDVEIAFDRKGWQAEVIAEGTRRGAGKPQAAEALRQSLDLAFDQTFHVEPSDVLFRMFAVAGRVPQVQ